MSLLGNLIKGAVVAKGVQVAQRELRKPENQKRIQDAVTNLKNRRQAARP